MDGQSDDIHMCRCFAVFGNAYVPSMVLSRRGQARHGSVFDGTGLVRLIEKTAAGACEASRVLASLDEFYLLGVSNLYS